MVLIPQKESITGSPLKLNTGEPMGDCCCDATGPCGPTSGLRIQGYYDGMLFPSTNPDVYNDTQDMPGFPHPHPVWDGYLNELLYNCNWSIPIGDYGGYVSLSGKLSGSWIRSSTGLYYSGGFWVLQITHIGSLGSYSCWYGNRAASQNNPTGVYPFFSGDVASPPNPASLTIVSA